jgi:hypothetical protein
MIIAHVKNEDAVLRCGALGRHCDLSVRLEYRRDQAEDKTTMSNAKSRYDAKTYDLVAVKLHKEKDKDIIAAIKTLTDEGGSKTDAIKYLLRKSL